MSQLEKLDNDIQVLQLQENRFSNNSSSNVSAISNSKYEVASAGSEVNIYTSKFARNFMKEQNIEKRKQLAIRSDKDDSPVKMIDHTTDDAYL